MEEVIKAEEKIKPYSISLEPRVMAKVIDDAEDNERTRSWIINHIVSKYYGLKD